MSLRVCNNGDNDNNNNSKKPKAVVVGGSIAGTSCAHALIEAGWDVGVLEKSCAPPTGNFTGAGLGIDPLSQKIIQTWLKQPQLLINSTLPLTIDQNQATNAEKKISCTLTRDPNYNFRAAHWADLYRILYNSLPTDIVLWGHYFLSFDVSDDKTSVTVKCKVLESGNTADIVGDLLIAADGCLSNIRMAFLPDFMLRYSGYCAWRGVFDFSSSGHDESILNLKKVYPDLGKCLYFDLSSGSHSVLYELLHNRMNWLWYINQPEPEVKGNSVTMKVSSDIIKRMHEEAKKVWIPELATIMRETSEPFLNVIYDADPLNQLFWDNVVLIGDAAHPTTPHGLRSTNMSILDAAVLGKCLQKWGLGNLHSALEEYQSIRLPVVSSQVLHSRRLGRIKQGLSVADHPPFDPTTADPEECEELLQKNMPFFTDVPSILKDGHFFGPSATE